MILPRYHWVPPRTRSLGPDCVAHWKAAGGTVFGWQALVVDGILSLSAEGDGERWTTGNDGVCVARQNGKGVIEQMIEVYCAFELGYPVVMHTAHEFATSQEHQLRLTTFIQDCPHLHAKVKAKGGYMFANGRESINLRNGSRIIFKARTKGGGRGYSGDILVWDEAMVLPSAVVAAQKPMLRASRAKFGPKTIYAGSAVDQVIHEHGVPFALIRERGIEKATGISYHEYSASFEHPDEMTDELLADRSWWALANPSMPDGLIAPEHMAEEIATLPARTAAVELACVGDWPRTDGLSDAVIPLERWNELEDPQSEPSGPVCFVLDVTPSRTRGAIAVVGKRADGLVHAELADHRAGTGWIVARLVELNARHQPMAIVCDEQSPAASLIPALEQAGLMVHKVNGPEHARSCGIFFDVIEQGTLRHRGGPELLSAVKGAATRPLGERWAWSRKSSNIDISPLVAVTLGVGYVLTNEEPMAMIAFV